MRDSFGRTIDYMRISITDRCNLRCRYCMPDGVECLPRREILSLEEIHAIGICAARLGIRHIKVTGGEPLVRKDCCELIQMLKSIPGIEKVTITTNGVLLEQYLEPLLKAGTDGINISLDTLDSSLYQKVTGVDCLESVLRVVERAAFLPIPVKINAVSIDFSTLAEGETALMEGEGGTGGLEDVRRLMELTRRYPVDVRFIEMMPIGYGKQFKTMNHQELLKSMHQMYPGLMEDSSAHGFGPAVYYRIPGALASVGLISAIHGKFCGDCNRIRLTSQGYLKTCLCYEDGVDLRAVLRQGLDWAGERGHYCWPLSPGDERIQKRLEEAICQAVAHKPSAHCFERPEMITESKNMIAIGG